LGFNFFQGGGFAEPCHVGVLNGERARLGCRVSRPRGTLGIDRGGAVNNTRGRVCSPRDLDQFCLGFVAAEGEIRIFPAIEAHDIGNEADLRCGRSAVRAVHLPVNVSGVNEQNGINAPPSICRAGSGLSLIEKPEDSGAISAGRHQHRSRGRGRD